MGKGSAGGLRLVGVLVFLSAAPRLGTSLGLNIVGAAIGFCFGKSLVGEFNGGGGFLFGSSEKKMIKTLYDGLSSYSPVHPIGGGGGGGGGLPTKHNYKYHQIH